MTYASEVAADSPVLWWRLGESSGTTAVDASGNGRDGTYAGSPTLGVSGLITDGNTAVDLDGVNDQVTYAATVLSSSSYLTVECWMKLPAITGHRLFGLAGTSNAHSLDITSGGSIVFQVNPTGTGSANGTSATGLISAGVTYHIVLTWSDVSNTARLYVDGTQVVTATNSGAINIATVSLGAVGNSGGVPAFGGVVDEFAIYGTELSGARIAAHYAAGVAVGTNEINFDADLPSIVGSLDFTTSRVVSFDADLPGLVGSLFLSPARAAYIDAEMPPLVGGLTLDNLDLTAVRIDATMPSIEGALNIGSVLQSQANRAGAWARDNSGTATWSPAVATPPATFSLPQKVVVAQAYEMPTFVDGKGVQYQPEFFSEPAHRDRILIAGRDVTFWRGVPTPTPDFQWVQPLGWGAATLVLPQVAVPFEMPGQGDLAWLRKGAVVEVQRVNTADDSIEATDWIGFVAAWNINGGSLQVECAGRVVGKAALQDKQNRLIQVRLDAGRLVANALRALRVPFSPPLGVTTGIPLIDWGGTGMLDYINELHAKMTTDDGEQWTTMPDDDGILQTYVRDTETIHGTVYADDSRAKVDLRSDMAEEPNRIFASAVSQSGMAIKNGAYPGLVQGDPAPYPMNDNSAFGVGTDDGDTDTGDGITVMGWMLYATGLVDFDVPVRPFSSAHAAGIRDLQRNAGLTVSGTMTPGTWAALFDISKTGYTLRNIAILPMAQDTETRPWRRSASGAVIARNPDYDPTVIPVDRTIAMGSGFTKPQVRQWARNELAGGEHWRGTIEFTTGAIVAGDHTPGDPITSILRTRDLRPGMNLSLPLFAGGIVVHVAGISVTDNGTRVQAVVDTRPGDTLPVWSAIQRDRDNRDTVHRSFNKQRKASDLQRENTFDEVGGTISPIRLSSGWTVFPVVAKQAGTIERIRMIVDPAREFVVAVFAKRITPGRLRRVTDAPLTLAGRERWTEEAVYNALDRDHKVLYVAGSDEDPCGYFPGRKSEGNTLNGKWNDESSFPFVTYLNDTDRGSVLWVAVWVPSQTTLQGGRIMWPSAEDY